jgi:hypothetical protein
MKIAVSDGISTTTLSKQATVLLLAVVFGVPIVIGAAWGTVVRAPARPPLSGSTVPLCQGASNFADNNGKPVGLAQFARDVTSFHYDTPTQAGQAITFYDSTLKIMGFYLIDSTDPLSHSYVRENEVSVVEVLHVSASAGPNGKATVTISLEAHPSQ